MAVRSRSSWSSRSTDSARVAVLGRRRSPGDGEFETHREVELLGVARRDPQPAPLRLQQREPGSQPTATVRVLGDELVACADATSGPSTGAENCGLDRSRNTNGSRMRLTVRRSGPPSVPLSTSTPGPIARHAVIDHRAAWLGDCDRRQQRAAPCSSAQNRARRKVGFGSRRAVRSCLPCPMPSRSPSSSSRASLSGRAWPVRSTAVHQTVRVAWRPRKRPAAQWRSERCAPSPVRSSSTSRACRASDFAGRLRRSSDDPSVAGLRPGVVLLVAFDPDARERLSLADDIAAVRSAFDQMLVRKGLVTSDQLELIRHGTRSQRCGDGDAGDG